MTSPRSTDRESTREVRIGAELTQAFPTGSKPSRQVRTAVAEHFRAFSGQEVQVLVASSTK